MDRISILSSFNCIALLTIFQFISYLAINKSIKQDRKTYWLSSFLFNFTILFITLISIISFDSRSFESGNSIFIKVIISFLKELAILFLWIHIHSYLNNKNNNSFISFPVIFLIYSIINLFLNFYIKNIFIMNILSYTALTLVTAFILRNLTKLSIDKKSQVCFPKGTIGNLQRNLMFTAVLLVFIAIINDVFFHINFLLFIKTDLLPVSMVLSAITLYSILLLDYFDFSLSSFSEGASINAFLNKKINTFKNDIISFSQSISFFKDNHSSLSKIISEIIKKSDSTFDYLNEKNRSGLKNEERYTNSESLISTIKEKLDNIENSSKTLNNVYNDLNEISEKGRIVSGGVLNLTSIIDGAKKNTEQSHKLINEINKSASNIGSISQTIENISEQAGILALNAAIESASTNEMGIGFNIVSGDLRALSALIKNQTVEIQKVLFSLKKNLEAGISSNNNVKKFFIDVDLITEKIFSLIISIVNQSDSINSKSQKNFIKMEELLFISRQNSDFYKKIMKLSDDINKGLAEENINIEKTYKLFAEIRSNIQSLNTSTQNSLTYNQESFDSIMRLMDF